MAKIIIQCVDCGTDREIGKACLNLVKRCKSCQVDFNRKAARDRYRKKKGIPLDKPVSKKDDEKPKKIIEEKPVGPKPIFPERPEISLEERLNNFRRNPWHSLGEKWEKQRIMCLVKPVDSNRKPPKVDFSMLEDKSTDDDW